MPPSRKSKIQSVTLIISVAIIAMVFGIMLDDKVVPESKKSLMSEEAEKQNSNKTAGVDAEIKQTLQQQDEIRRKQQSAKIEQLEQKSEVITQKADGIISRTDEIISKAGLPQPSGNKAVPVENQKISKRLAKARDRLDAIKSKKVNKNPEEI